MTDHRSSRVRRSSVCRIGLALSLLLLPGAAAPPTDDAGCASISGRILIADGQPAAGAVVRALPADLRMDRRHDPASAWLDPIVIRTDAEGRFDTGSLPRERYALRVEHDDAAPATIETIPCDSELTLELQPGRVLRGRVVRAADERALAGAIVRGCDDGGAVFGVAACREVRADDDGRFVLRPLGTGRTIVTVELAGHAVSRRVVPEADGTDELLVRLEPGGSIDGRIVDPRGEPLPRVLVIARAEQRRRRGADGPPLPRTHSDDDGRFVFPGLHGPATYRLAAMRAGWPMVSSETVRVEPGRSTSELELVLYPSAAIRFRLVDPDDEPVTETVSVVLRRPDARGAPFAELEPVPDEWIEPRPDGSRQIEHLGSGVRDVLIDVDGWLRAERESVRTVGGETTDLGEIRLERGETLSGAVVDDGGAPIVGAVIEARQDGRTLRHTSGDGGLFELGGLTERPVKLSARAEGHAPHQPQSVAPPRNDLEIMLRRAGSIRGRVVTVDGPATTFTVAIDGAANARRPAAAAPRSSRSFSSEQGEFEYDAVPPGRYVVKVTAPDHTPAVRTQVEVAAGDGTDLGRIELDRGFEISGNVVTRDGGAPVAGATIRRDADPMQALRRGDRDATGSVTDQHGDFRLGGLPPGPSRLRISHPSYAATSAEIELGRGRPSAELTIELGSGGSLGGTVMDDDGSPLAGALVAASPADRPVGERRSSTADADGRYAIDRLAAGSYTVSRYRPDGALDDVRRKTAVIRESETTRVDFGPDEGIVVSGLVLRGDTPLAEHGLSWIPDGRTDTASMRFGESDRAGGYRITLPEPGDYVVSVTAPGRSLLDPEAIVRVAVPDRSTASIDLRVPTTTLRGRVVDEDGRGVANASLRATRIGATVDEPGAQGRATSQSDGTFSISGLDPGEYGLRANAAGFRQGSIDSVVVSEGLTDELVLRLESGVTCRGRVLDGEGQPVPHAYVSVHAAGDPAGAVGAMTDLAGGFELTMPSDGPVDVWAVGPGWAPASRRGWVASAENDAELTLRLSRGSTLEIVVADPAGAPRPGVDIELRPIAAQPLFLVTTAFSPIGATDAQGRTRAEHLAAGSYEVTVVGRDDLPARRVEVGDSAVVSVALLLP